MYYTVTLNPSLDYRMKTSALARGETNRSSEEEITYGGKGINVAVMLNALGEEATALGFVGGFTGDALRALLKDAGLMTDFVTIAAPTRINVKLDHGESITEVNACGPAVTKTETEAFWTMLEGLCEGDTLVLAGSVPSSLPKDFYRCVMEKLADRGVRFAVDTTGEALLRALPCRPFLIKPNLAELEEAVGERLCGDEAIVCAARKLQAAGARNILVSLGGNGALLLDEMGTVYKQKAPSGIVKNTVGAGDSMLAGFLVGLKDGFAEALSWGVAAGSATAFSEGLADSKRVKEIRAQL